MTTHRYVRLVIACQSRGDAARSKSFVPGGYVHYENGRWWVATDFSVEERPDELARARARRLRRPLIG